MDPENVVLLGMTLVILAGVAVLWMAMTNRRQIREMEHRERLAMIDRGLIPPPELDPAGFERHSGVGPVESQSAARSRSMGVILVGLGLGLMAMISFAAESPQTGVGIGGAVALLGAAFIVNAALMAKTSRPRPPQPWESRPPSRPSGPLEPPPSSMP